MKPPRLDREEAARLASGRVRALSCRVHLRRIRPRRFELVARRTSWRGKHNKPVELQPAEVQVFEFALEEARLALFGQLHHRMCVGHLHPLTGARDGRRRSSCGAHLTSIVRTAVGEFLLERAIPSGPKSSRERGSRRPRRRIASSRLDAASAGACAPRGGAADDRAEACGTARALRSPWRRIHPAASNSALRSHGSVTARLLATGSRRMPARLQRAGAADRHRPGRCAAHLPTRRGIGRRTLIARRASP